ncbi:hypothetical protein FRC07_012716, partial [Ceratobasidium sp. 392]
MSHPLTWPSLPEFCPIRQFPATSLTQDLSPEQSADILLLGCGDPCHILYTISTDVTAPPARNIVLFTLLDDGTPPATVWDIFYHFKISTHVAGVLTTHARELVKLSGTCEAWRKSKYGSFIKFADSNSLFELRRFWIHYAEFPNLSAIRLDSLAKELALMSDRVAEKLESGFINWGASSSATVVRNNVINLVSNQFGQYWKNGTTATTNKDIKKATHLNSTFCYSQACGETFNGIPITIFPQGFHFAPAFIPVEIDPVGSNVTSAMAKAKQQFKAYCSALEASRKANALTLRFFVGDGLALCKALNKYAKTGATKTEVFAAPWRAAPIDLTEHAVSEPKAPLSFDVIDSSTLADNLGMINLLLATECLLKKHPASQAVLYMDLRFGARAPFTESRLVEELCIDVPKAGLSFGLVPRPYVSLFTSQSYTHEFLPGDNSGGPLMQRVAWVDPCAGDKRADNEPKPIISFNPYDLIQMVFGDIHRRLHSYDVMSPAMALSLQHGQLVMCSSAHYTCETLADILVNLPHRVQVPNDFLPAIATAITFKNDKEPTENRFFKLNTAEMKLQYRFRGLLLDLQKHEPKETISTAGVFRGWPDIPREVCVVLTVPNAALDLLRHDREEFSPRLACTIKDPSSEDNQPSTYYCLHAAWGKCIPLDQSNERFTIEEDPDGFRGHSDLIVSFWVDAYALRLPDLEISLALRYSPLTYANYSRELDQGLNLYTATIEDPEHVLVLRERPMGLLQTQQTPTSHASNPNHVALKNGSVAHRLTVPNGPMAPPLLIETRVNVETEGERAALAAGVAVTTTQIGPCTIRVLFGNAEHIVRFPYPIHGIKVKTRVDQATHRIYLTTSPVRVLESGGYPTDFFPTLQQAKHSPWNIHHVHLDRMPKLDIRNVDRDPKRFDWLTDHTSLQMSERERYVQHCTSPARRGLPDALVNIKESIDTLIHVYAGFQDAHISTFVLSEPSHGIYLAICVNGLRLDLGAATVVLDTAIVPWSSEVAKILDPRSSAYEIQTHSTDVAVWKGLMIAYVERCRTWTHGPNCEYESASGMHLRNRVQENLLCSCGRGLGFESSGWKVAS